MRQVVKWVGSLKMAVVVLLAIAAVLAYATSVDYEVAVHRVYRTWWFSALLVVLGVNLAASAWVRYPWKRSQWGFVLTHAGIIVILVGSLLTQWWGFEGSLMLAEGTQRDVVPTDERLLVARRDDGGETTHAIQGGRWDVYRPQTFRVDDRTTVTVDRYYPHAGREEKMLPGGTLFAPAIRFKLSNAQVAVEEWLVPNDPRRSRFEMGPLTVVVKQLTAGQLREWRRAPERVAAMGVLQVTVDGRSFEVPVEASVNRPFKLEGTPYSLWIRRVLRHAMVEQDALVNKSDQWVNPALELHLVTAEGFERHTVFALFPQFDTFHGLKSRSGVKFHYEAPGSSGNQLVFLTAPGEPVWCVLRSRQGGMTVKPLRVGQSLETPWMNLAVQVAEYLPQSTREVTYRSLPVESGKEGYPEALHLLVTASGVATEHWVELGATSVATNGWQLTFRQGERPLGFSVKLKDFHIGKDPGTERAASFSSEVTVEDARLGRAVSQKIAMNQPLVYGGYKLFQASYMPVAPGEPEVSILAVARDPGIPLKYGGSVILIVGIALMFYWNPRQKELSQ